MLLGKQVAKASDAHRFMLPLGHCVLGFNTTIPTYNELVARAPVAPKDPMTSAWLGFETEGLDLSLEAGRICRLGFEPGGWDLSLVVLI